MTKFVKPSFFLENIYVRCLRTLFVCFFYPSFVSVFKYGVRFLNGALPCLCFGNEVYTQVIGIPMGTNFAALVADLFLFCYKSDFLLPFS